MKKFFVMLSIILLFPCNILADEKEEPPVFRIDPLVVVATGEPEAIAEMPASITVITREEIERSGALNLMDLLVREPGVWVARQGGLGFGGSVSIRGFGGSPPTQVAVTVDGHPSQMGIMGHILPSAYLVQNVERVEILRGPAGATAGHMAMGGVINIITRGGGDEEARASARAAYGTFDSRDEQLWFAGNIGRADYRAQLGRIATDGSNPFAKYDANNYSLALDGGISNEWNAAFRAQQVLYTAFDQREVANAFAEGREPRLLTQDFDRRDYDLSFRREGQNASEIKLFRTHGVHQFEDGFHAKDYGEGLMLRHRTPLENGRIQLGLDWMEYGGRIFSPSPIAQSFRRREPSLFALANHHVTEDAQVWAGIRYTDPQGFKARYIPQFGLQQQIGQDWTAFASLRDGYRTPSFRELFLFGINNPELTPEKTRQYEVGVQRSLAGGGSLAISLFRIDADDLIVLRPRTDGPGLQLVNAGEVTREGIEIGLRRPIGIDTAIYGIFSYLDAGAIKEQTVGRKLTAGIDHRLRGWLLSSDLQYVSRLYDFDETRTLVEEDPFIVINTKVSRSLGDNFRAGLVIENLFDRTYRITPSYPYPMPGRAFRLEVTREW